MLFAPAALAPKSHGQSPWRSSSARKIGHLYNHKTLPVIALGQHEALRRLQAKAMHLGQREEERRKSLPALRNAEFRGGLDGVRGVEAGIGEADHLRF